MPWPLFWTITLQVVLFCLIAAVPVGLLITVITSAWSSSVKKRYFRV